MMNMFSFLSSLLVLLFGTSRAFQQPAVPTTTSSSSSSLTQFFLYGQGTLLSSQEAQLPQPTQSYLDKQEWQTRQEEAVLPSERMRQEHMQDSQSSGVSDVTTAKPFQPQSSSNNDYKYNNNDKYRVDDNRKEEYRVDDNSNDDYEENEYDGYENEYEEDCREEEEPAYEESYSTNGGFVDPFRATRPTSYYQSNNQHARFAQGGLDDAFGRFTGIGDPFRRSKSYYKDPLRNKVLTATTSDMRMPPPGGLALGAPPPMMPPPQPNYYYGSSYYYEAPRPRNGPPPNRDPYRNPYDANTNPQGRSVMLQGQSRMSWTIQGQPNNYNNNRNNRRPPPNDEWNTRPPPPPRNNDRNTRPPSSTSSRPSLSQEEQARNDHNRRNPQVGGRPPRGEGRSREYSSSMPPPPNRQGYSRQQGQMVARPNVWSQDLGQTTRRPQGKNREVLQHDPGGNGWSQQPAYQLGRRVQGGASEYFRVEPNVRTVQLNLSSDGYPIMALVELILPDGSVRKIAQVYVDNGSMRPYTTTIDTPLAQDCTIRVENTGPLEYPLLARVGPAPYD